MSMHASAFAHQLALRDRLGDDPHVPIVRGLDGLGRAGLVHSLCTGLGASCSVVELANASLEDIQYHHGIQRAITASDEGRSVLVLNSFGRADAEVRGYAQDLAFLRRHGEQKLPRGLLVVICDAPLKAGPGPSDHAGGRKVSRGWRRCAEELNPPEGFSFADLCGALQDIESMAEEAR